MLIAEPLVLCVIRAHRIEAIIEMGRAMEKLSRYLRQQELSRHAAEEIPRVDEVPQTAVVHRGDVRQTRGPALRLQPQGYEGQGSPDRGDATRAPEPPAKGVCKHGGNA